MQRMVRKGGIFEEHDMGLRCKIRMKREQRLAEKL